MSAREARQAFLRNQVHTEGGEWDRSRVSRTYTKHGIAAPKHRTQRRDMEALHRGGDLDLREQPGRRYYTPREP